MSAEEIRDALLNWLEIHSSHCPDPENCHEPINILAYLAHSLGMRADSGPSWLKFLREYERTCEGCQHMRN